MKSDIYIFSFIINAFNILQRNFRLPQGNKHILSSSVLHLAVRPIIHQKYIFMYFTKQGPVFLQMRIQKPSTVYWKVYPFPTKLQWHFFKCIYSQDCSNSCPLSQWCHPPISSFAIPFPSCLQSFPASGSFPIGQFFTSGSQSIGVSASASVLPMNIQLWFL